MNTARLLCASIVALLLIGFVGCHPAPPPASTLSASAARRDAHPTTLPAFADTRQGKPVMFVAGDDAANKPKVMDLVGELGFEMVDAGPLRNARLLEAHAMLWIDLALARGQGRDFAFAILRR